MKLLERNFQKEIDSSLAVVLWNYWDVEHLTVVHDAYSKAEVLYHDKNQHIYNITWKLPILSFLSSSSLAVAIMRSPTVFQNYQKTWFGIPTIATIRLEETGVDSCRIKMNYKFVLRGWRKILAPFMWRMMESWNEKVWVEDLPLKVRRQKALRWGFRDFVGFPDKVEERVNDRPLTQSLPVPRPPGAEVDRLLELGSITN